MCASDIGKTDTLVLEYGVFAQDRVQLSTEFRCGGRCELGSTYPQVCRYEELLERSGQLIDILTQALEVMGDCRSDGDLALAGGYVRELQDAGARLRACLLPDDVIRALERTTSITHLIFRCDPLLNGVPFDCMFLWDDFIAFLYGTGKQLLSSGRRDTLLPRRTPALPLRCSSIVDPGKLIPDAAREDFTAFLDAWTSEESGILDFGRFIMSRPTTAQDVTRLVWTSDIVTFVCHHRYNDNAPEKSGYVLDETRGGEARLFSAADLLEAVKIGDVPPYMIVSVSCESGVTRGWEVKWPEHSRVHGMVDAAMRIGVRHYISGLLNIPAHRSGKVLLPFYRALAGGRTVGHSLRLARMELRGTKGIWNGGTVLGLAFVLYGDPSDAYIPVESRVESGDEIAGRPGQAGAQETRVAESAAPSDQTALPISASQAFGSFAVLARGQAQRSYEIARSWFYVGRSDTCHVVLRAAGVSSLHATCVQVGSDFLIIDHGSTNGTFVDGSRICQRSLRTGDAVHIDRFWLFFRLAQRREAANLLRSKNGGVEAGGTLRRVDKDDSWRSFGPAEPGTACVVLESSSGLTFGSDSKPILIGSDPGAPMHLVGAVAPLHAFVSWDVVVDKAGGIADAGVFVDDLGSGISTVLNGTSVNRAKLAHGDVLAIGGHQVKVSFVGDVRLRSETLFKVVPTPGTAAVTCVAGPGLGQSLLLGGQKKHFLIGHSRECDLTLPGDEVSGSHARIDCGPPGPNAMCGAISLTDLGSANGTFVNGKELASNESRSIAPGDIIRLSRGNGHADLLLHYEL